MTAKDRADNIQDYVDFIGERDLYTQEHSCRVMVFAETIHSLLPQRKRHTLRLADLKQAALLHDIGKMFIPDDILNKNGKLNDFEWEHMRRHPLHGKDFLTDTPFETLSPWILYHHERIDGLGYYGVRGSSIPLPSRILAVADSFSAMRDFRIYRQSKTLEETIKELRRSAGTQLDGEIVESFCRWNERN